MQDPNDGKPALGDELSPLEFRRLRGGEGRVAVDLRREIYSADLVPDPDDGLDDAAIHVAAFEPSGSVVASFRILGPELRPFDFEHLRPLDSLVASGRRPAMIGRLCVRRDYRNIKHSTRVLAGLLAEILEYGRTEAISDYFLYTFAHLRKFYTKGGFSDSNLVIDHKHWGRLYLMSMSVAQQVTRSLVSGSRSKVTPVESA